MPNVSSTLSASNHVLSIVSERIPRTRPTRFLRAVGAKDNAIVVTIVQINKQELTLTGGFRHTLSPVKAANRR